MPAGPCHHNGFHSARSRSRLETGRLRFVVVCDDCEAEIRELEVIDYEPRFEPFTGVGTPARKCPAADKRG